MNLDLENKNKWYLPLSAVESLLLLGEVSYRLDLVINASFLNFAFNFSIFCIFLVVYKSSYLYNT